MEARFNANTGTLANVSQAGLSNSMLLSCTGLSRLYQLSTDWEYRVELLCVTCLWLPDAWYHAWRSTSWWYGSDCDVDRGKIRELTMTMAVNLYTLVERCRCTKRASTPTSLEVPYWSWRVSTRTGFPVSMPLNEEKWWRPCHLSQPTICECLLASTSPGMDR